MAAYYHGGSEIQGEGLQTLYLMNPGYVGYSSDAPAVTTQPSVAAAANMVIMNSGGNSIASMGNLGHLHQHNPPFFGIPLQATVAAPPPQEANPHALAPRLQYNLWPTTAAQNQQGLSLSLSPQQASHSGYRAQGREMAPVPALDISPASVGVDEAPRISGSTSSTSGVSNGMAGINQGVLTGSKYLMAAQELLDEVVNVGVEIKDEKMKAQAPATKLSDDDPKTSQPEENSSGEASGKQAAELMTTAERQELQMKKAKLVNMLDEVEQRYRQYRQQMQLVVAAFEAAAGPSSGKTYTALALRTISKQFRCLREAITAQIKGARKSLGEDMEAGIGEGSNRLRAVEQQLRQQRALQQLGMIQPNAWRPQRGLPERSVSVLRAWLFEHFLHPYPKDSDKLMLAKQTGLTRSQVSNWFINARVRLWKPMVEEMYMEEMKEQEFNGRPEGNVAGKGEAKEEPKSPTAASLAETNMTVPASNVGLRTNKLKSIIHDNAMGQPSCFSFLEDPSDSGTINFQGEDEEEELEEEEDQEEEEMVRGSFKKMKNDFHEQGPDTIPLMGSVMELKPNIGGGGNDSLFYGEGRPTGYSLIGDTAGGNAGGGPFVAYQNYMDQFAARFHGNGVSLTLGLPHPNGENSPSLAVAGAPSAFLSGQVIPMGIRRIDQKGSQEDQNEFCSIDAAPSTDTHSATAFHENVNIQNRKRGAFATQLLQDFVV